MTESSDSKLEQADDVLNMDDDAIAALSLEEFESQSAPTETDDKKGEGDAHVAQAEAAVAADTQSVVTGTTETDGADDPAAANAAESNDPDKADPAKSEAAADDATKEITDTVDYKTEYEKLMAPFKANGKEMKVNSVEDIRQLMQMGANYNKKMAGLKPNIKILKMLENNGLLDENKLSFLIDLDKKDPKAIQKLMKDSGIDPLEMDVNSDTDYAPKTYNVSDTEVELDAVLDEISTTDTYSTTIDIINTKWDDASKQVLVNHPSVIKAINDQVASGIYDQINAIVEKERMLGRLNGVSDIAAYKLIGDQLHAEGKLGNPTPVTPSAAVAPAPTPAKAPVDTKLKDKKRAASGVPQAAPTKRSDAAINPLGLSDEEFEKAAAKFL